MYRGHKVLLFVLFLCVGFAAKYFSWGLTEALVSSLVTLIGIMFGFTISSVAAMSGSDFLKRQAHITDGDAAGVLKTNAQRLHDYFAFSCYSDIFVIVLLIVSEVAPSRLVSEWMLSSVVYAFISVCVTVSALLVQLLLRYFIESAD